MNVTLYTIHCPKCKVLAMKLDKTGIPYSVVDNEDEVIEKGRSSNMPSAPLLEVDGEVMDFSNAIKWCNEVSH